MTICMTPVISREVVGSLNVIADAHVEQDEETDKVWSYQESPVQATQQQDQPCPVKIRQPSLNKLSNLSSFLTTVRHQGE